MRTLFLFVLTIILFFQTCKKEEFFPVYELADVPIPNLADNEIDYRRLCIAEVISQMLAEEDFRQYLQQQSINIGENWNEEFLLIQHLNELVTADFTFLHFVEQVLRAQASSCFATVGDFMDALFDDPLLVLKLPDGIPAQDWDVSRTVPFLYTKTLKTIRYPTGMEDRPGVLGLHSSGAVDVYLIDQPNYFPVVLKYSEDFVAVDDNLNLDTGTRIIDLHSNIPSSAYSSSFFEQLEKIETTELYLVSLTDLMNHIYAARAQVFEPNPNVPCSEECSNDCIPQADLRLLATGLSFDTRNDLTLENDFSSYYRIAGQQLLSENLVPLVLGRQVSNVNFYDWQRFLLGSYRLNDLFDVTFTHTVSYENFSVNGKNTELPAFSATADVNEIQQLPLPNLLLAENITEGDLFRYASYQLKLDAVVETRVAADDQPVSTYGFRRGVVLNYNLYCDDPQSIGLNSIALQATY